MWIAVHYKPAGRSLWPGLDTALKKELSEDDKYRWLLAERVLGKLVEEAGRDGVQVGIVIIPYLAQVYDEVWSTSFGTAPYEYDRWIASKGCRFVRTDRTPFALTQHRPLSMQHGIAVGGCISDKTLIQRPKVKNLSRRLLRNASW